MPQAKSAPKNYLDMEDAEIDKFPMLRLVAHSCATNNNSVQQGIRDSVKLQVASIKIDRCETCQLYHAVGHVSLSPRRVAQSLKKEDKKRAECNTMQQDFESVGLRHISTFLPKIEKR